MESDKIIPVKKVIRKWSIAEKQAFCKAGEQSGLTRSAYCRREGLCLPTFCSWLKHKTSKTNRRRRP